MVSLCCSHRSTCIAREHCHEPSPPAIFPSGGGCFCRAGHCSPCRWQTPIRAGRCVCSRFHACRRQRHHCAPDGAVADGAAGPDVHRREPPWRRHQHRGRGSDQFTPRRLRAVRHQSLECDQRHPLRKTQLQLHARHAAGRGHRPGAGGVRDQLCRFQRRQSPSSSPTPRPIRAGSTWGRPASAAPAISPANCSR